MQFNLGKQAIMKSETRYTKGQLKQQKLFGKLKYYLGIDRGYNFL